MDTTTPTENKPNPKIYTSPDDLKYVRKAMEAFTKIADDHGVMIDNLTFFVNGDTQTVVNFTQSDGWFLEQ